MRKLLTGILASTMILSSLSMVAMAQETSQAPLEVIETATLASSSIPTSEDDFGTYKGSYTEGDFRYSLYEENFVVLSKYTGKEEHITIPAVLGGAPVTVVDLNLNTDVISVDLPDTVTYVDLSNFYSLQSLFVPDSVTTLYLTNLYKIESLYVPLSVKEINLYGSSRGSLYYQGSQADSTHITNHSSRELSFDNWVYNYNHSSWSGASTPAPEATPPASGATFPDWMTPFVDFVSAEIMPDITPENYGNASNRGLIAQSLYNMCGDGGTYTSAFTDAGSNASAIGWCYENAVMSGNSETWFDTEGKVTREQFALILRQLATVQGKDVSYEVAVLSDFSDGTSGNAWALSGLAWAVENGLMSGNSNGTLNPMGDVSRVEVAVMLNAFDGLT